MYLWQAGNQESTWNIVPPYLPGKCPKTPSGCLKLWTMLSPVYTVFFSCTYIPMIKVNL